MELFEKYEVFNHREMHSRYEIGLEQYVLTVGVEAKLTLEIGSHQDPAGGGALPDRAGAEPAGAEGGGVEADTTALDTVSVPLADLAGRAGHADRRARDATTGRPRWPRRSTPGRSCCPRWRRCARPPTCSKAWSPTTSGRCRPTRRCCTSCSCLRLGRPAGRPARPPGPAARPGRPAQPPGPAARGILIVDHGAQPATHRRHAECGVQSPMINTASGRGKTGTGRSMACDRCRA